eukprot:1195006-Prorocentrum_minimum.AAC.3
MVQILKRSDYFGKYGKIIKVSVNRNGVYSSIHGGAATGSAYITFVRDDDAIKCIQMVDGTMVDGKVLRLNIAFDRSTRGSEDRLGGPPAAFSAAEYTVHSGFCSLCLAGVASGRQNTATRF